MCMASLLGGDKPAPPVAPPEYAAQKAPTEANGAARSMKDRLRSRSATFLTPNDGVGAADMSGKKVLLGQ
jgi:hypothetical protein